MKNIVFHIRNESETRLLGMKLARDLRPGDILGISGDFGAGKTRLIKGICEYFGIPADSVTSPSFTLIHEYTGKFKLVHVDTYRLNHDADFELLDLDYYISAGAIVLIEWAQKVSHMLPAHTRFYEMTVTGRTTRTLTRL